MLALRAKSSGSTVHLAASVRKNTCQEKHLLALHEVNLRPNTSTKEVVNREESYLTSSASNSLYLDQLRGSNRVLLKVVPVLLRYRGCSFSTFAFLDDGSEWSMLLPAAAKTLETKRIPEDLPLRTVQQDIQVLHGQKVSFHLSLVANPKVSYRIDDAFTTSRLSLAQHTYPLENLQKKYKHLRGLPIPALKEVEPLLLLGSDHAHLITPAEPIRLGLLPEDRPLLRFLLHDLKVESPRVFERQVLPFGTTCSPCCATFALQLHMASSNQSDDTLRSSVEYCFYVDNCQQSVCLPEVANQLVDRLRSHLSLAGFKLRQWACIEPSVLAHLPQEAQSQSLDL